MAKVYPIAELEPRETDVPLTFDLFARISLLAKLQPGSRNKLSMFRGAMRLRRFGKNEVVCRQGEEDCTAYYLLKSQDLQELRTYPGQREQKNPDERTASE